MCGMRLGSDSITWDAFNPGGCMADDPIFPEHELIPKELEIKLPVREQKDQTMKKDSGKPSLFPILGAAQALAEIAAVLHFGAKKYAPSKWREGMNWSRLIDALLRHVTAFANGESTDPETGLSHLGHAGCCVLFLLTYQLENLGTDDRWPLSKKQD